MVSTTSSGMARFLVWQVALVAVASVVIGHRAPSPWEAAALLLAVASLPRHNDRWLYQWLWARLMLRTRFGGQVRRGPARGLLPLRETLVPELDTSPAGPPSSRLGVLEEGFGVAAVLSVDYHPECVDRLIDAMLNADRLAGVLGGGALHLSCIQLIVRHSTPSTDRPARARRPRPFRTAEPPSDSPDSRPTVRLRAGRRPTPGPGPAAPAADRAVWIALRLDPTQRNDDVEPWGVPALHRALRLLARRTIAVLARSGISARMLDEEQAQAALLDCAGLKAPDAMTARDVVGRYLETGAVPSLGSQSWRSWTCEGLSHRTYWIRRWPREGLARLHRACADLDAATVVWSLTVAASHRPDELTARALVRVVDQIDTPRPRVWHTFSKAARSAGAHAVALNGEHAAAVVGTLPLASELATASRWPAPHRFVLDSMPFARKRIDMS